MNKKILEIEKYNYSNRRFQLLFYQMSHSEMIIRSRKYDNIRNKYYNNTIDIIFADVKYMEIPNDFYGVKFRCPNDEDIRYLKSKTEKNIKIDEVIVLISNEQEFYVVASVVNIRESELDDMELPIHCFLYDFH